MKRTYIEKNNIFKQVRCIAPNFVKNIYENLRVKNKYEFNLSVQQEQLAINSNRISLNNEKDPMGIPYSTI